MPSTPPASSVAEEFAEVVVDPAIATDDAGGVLGIRAIDVADGDHLHAVLANRVAHDLHAAFAGRRPLVRSTKAIRARADGAHDEALIRTGGALCRSLLRVC